MITLKRRKHLLTISDGSHVYVDNFVQDIVPTKTFFYVWRDVDHLMS